jgi:UDP-glucuronate 4-epimerase
MKILVTGTAGFIGYHLAKKLLERGDEVVGLDNINDYYDVNLKYARLAELGIDKDELKDNELLSSKTYPNHKFIKANLEDSDTINKLFETEKFDAVCNLAAQAGVRYSLENPHAYIQSNVVGFMNILEACRNYGVKNLSYASSSSVYGTNISQPFKTTDMTDTPVSLYAATKKANELMAHTYSHLYGIQTTGLRFFTVYGEYGRPDMAPMLFADAITHDRPIKVFNHGNMSRDFTYVGDIVDGVVRVIDNPSVFKVYNIGNNSPVQLLDFIKILENSLGKVAVKNFMDMQDGDVVSTYADVSDLINDFGYKPDTSLEVGIDRFVKWYKEFYSYNCKPIYTR